VAALLAAFAFGAGAEDKPLPGLTNKGPLSPREEMATFKVPKGFRVELVACEPAIVDPVAMAFDEDGRLFVAEMPGYPNAGVGTGTITSGKIKLLEDRDGDGFYEKSTLYADGLRFPMSAMPYKGGLLVAVAPDILHLKDTDGDGKADQRRILYTGFDLANIQQLVNSLQWGLDNWVYGVAGGYGGSIRSAEKPGAAAVTLRGRSFRFRPDIPGSLEPTSGGGQYGLTADAWGRWFTATNSQHLRHIVLPDQALRRNPALPVRAVTLDIPDHGPACKVYRVSPFEAWRVERTRRRREGKDASRFPSTELVPGGYSTSTCSPLVYDATLFPEAYRGNVFVCDPANNLIHRDVLVPKGATFTARRGEADCEFLASTDNWFRPVWLSLGPDGAMYVLDFYREVIETPLSLPEDIKKRVNLQSRKRGRIWRVLPEKAKRRPRPKLSKARSEELVKHLADDNAWWRMTAQRLLVERQDKGAVKALESMARQKRSAVGRAHALWTLEGLKALPDRLIEEALKDEEAGVREQALRLAEERLPRAPALLPAVARLAGDAAPRVRFQAALTLGASAGKERLPTLAALLRNPASDSWTQTAVLSSCGKQAPELLVTLVGDAQFRSSPADRQRQAVLPVAALAAATADEARLASMLALLRLQPGQAVPAPWQLSLAEGLGEGLRNTRRSLAQLLEQTPESLKAEVRPLRDFFGWAEKTTSAAKGSLSERLTAARLLGYAPFGVAKPTLAKLLSPRQPAELQLAAIRALALHPRPEVAPTLLGAWSGYSPTVRRECVEALFARTERLQTLLAALEKKTVLAGQLEPARVEQLRRHRDPAVRARAQKVLVGVAAPERQKVVDAYRAALDLKADRLRGKAVFKKTCATCHRLENEGYEVGPDLLAALKNKTREQLLLDILDPSREVDPRFQNYIVTTTKGQTLTGLIATETASSITLRRGEKAEDVLLRSQIEDITATGKSVMPENLETQLSKQDLADVIEYLLSVVR
jgi:putative membrane-bound dehydrogenase-like protein